MLRKIKLYGPLRKKFGREFRVDVDSPGEAIRALQANCPGFMAHLHKHSSPGYRVFIGKSSVTKEEIGKHSSEGDIKIVPVVAGRGSGKSIGQIILGVVLIVASIYYPPLASSAYAVNVGMMGAAMVLGGVSTLLAPSPNSRESSESPENKPNDSFNGPINTIGQGNPVPIAYGEVICGGQLISAGLSVDSVGPVVSKNSPLFTAFYAKFGGPNLWI